MTNEQVIDAVLAWVAAVLPDVATSTYDYVPAGKPKALPDCIASLEAERVARADARFQIFALQQVAVRVSELELSLMVDNGTEEADGAAAAATLREYVEALTLSILNDCTLGGRVDAASPEIEADYTRPFVQYADGVRGREVRVGIAVAVPVVAAD